LVGLFGGLEPSLRLGRTPSPSLAGQRALFADARDPSRSHLLSGADSGEGVLEPDASHSCLGSRAGSPWTPRGPRTNHLPTSWEG